MSRKRKIFVVVSCFFALGLATAAWLGAVSFFQPLNASLGLNIQTLRAVQYKKELPRQKQLIVQNTLASQNDGAALPEHMPVNNSPLVHAEKKPPVMQIPDRQTTTSADTGVQASTQAVENCGNSGSMLILFLGTDERDRIPYGADVIRFIKIDFSKFSVTCVALSRDLWVKTPALVEKHIRENRLGEVFDIVQTSTKGTLEEQNIAATKVITQTIYDNFGVVPDHYLTVPQSVFPAFVDALGGIEVNVPRDQDVLNYVLIAGKQNLNGHQALAYVRLLEGNKLGDFGRNLRQLPFIQAVLSRMVEPANLVKMPDIFSQMQDSIVSDLSPALIASLTCMLSKVPRSNITFHTLQPDMTSPGSNDSLLPDTPGYGHGSSPC